MKFAFTFLITLSLTASFGQDNSKNINSKKGIAIDGYDPVTYYAGKPEEGNDDITASYNGVTYHFLSQKNKEVFLNNPKKYEPAYGGWCAYAMGETGEKVKVDPETFKIIDGKIYLFYNFWGTNTLESWNNNEKALKEKADNNWKQLTN